MTQVEKLVQACKKATPDGVNTKTLSKILKGSSQSVHTAAFSAKKKGLPIVSKGGRYFYIDAVAASPAETKISKTSMSLEPPIIPKALLSSMDPTSQADLIEQVRRAKLHIEIAKSIISSHKFAAEMKGSI